jgi:hypothetical protein
MQSCLVTFALLFLLLSAKAQTSVYHPFPDSNTVWNFNNHTHQVGEIIYKESVHNQKSIMLNNNLSEGVYFLILSNNGDQALAKLIVN